MNFSMLQIEQDNFDRNLAVLRRRDRILADRIDDLEILSDWKIWPTADGLKTVRRAEAGSGLSRFVHSRISPGKEAERWMDLIRGRCETLAVLGFGLGYHLMELQEEGHFNGLIVIEADPELFHIAMRLADLTPIILDPRVHLLIDESLPTVSDSLKRLLVGDISYSTYLPSTLLHPDYYQPIEQVLEESIRRNRMADDARLSQGVAKLLNEMKRQDQD